MPAAARPATPARGEPDNDRTRLGGGLALKSPFGTFYVPNISPDPSDGIGEWSEANFVTALWKGTSPWGKNLFPAFPYTSYQNMALADMRDLFAYLKTLPPVTGRTRRHDLHVPLQPPSPGRGVEAPLPSRRDLAPDPSQSAQWNRGAYLVNGPGHCAECHSPRNFLGAIVESQRFAGGPSPDGKSFMPNITPVGLQHRSKDDIAWSQSDIATSSRTAWTLPVTMPAT